VWEAISPDPVLTPYEDDYRWLAQVYESLKPPSGNGKLLWHALDAKTIQLIHSNVTVAPAHLEWCLRWAARSRIPAFVKLAKTVRKHRERILAAIELNLSNSKLEGLNFKNRLINHRGCGHHSAEAVIAMIYLCCGGLTIEPPTLPLAG
jgi:hypothetical protein